MRGLSFSKKEGDHGKGTGRRGNRDQAGKIQLINNKKGASLKSRDPKQRSSQAMACIPTTGTTSTMWAALSCSSVIPHAEVENEYMYPPHWFRSAFAKSTD